MHIYNLDKWKQEHNFSTQNPSGEKRTQIVFMLTATTMVVEIIAGLAFGSMALLADGWHMGTHTAAFMITIFAYRYTKKNAKNPAFSFGTAKVNALGGFASSIALVVVALIMAIESIQRFFEPQQIHFDQAIAVCFIGLSVNLISALLLKEDHHHHHHHHHGHEHHAHHHHEHKHDHNHNHKHEQDHKHEQEHGHKDHNLRAAYFHVLADALTSVLAIIALLGGKYFGWHWLDASIGLVGAIIISRWAYGLIMQTSPILLDASKKAEQAQIKQLIEANLDNRVVDLHVWELGAEKYAAIISIVTHYPKSAEHYKNLLKDLEHLSHISVEVNTCTDTPCIEL